jgi:uncharacterized membrane protein YccC
MVSAEYNEAAGGMAGNTLAAPTRSAVRGWIDRAVPLKSEALSLAAGLRAATACAVPVLIAELTGRHALSWIAIVAFWGCIADSGGSWRTRVTAMMSFTGLATIDCFTALMAGRSDWTVFPFIFFWSFAASLSRLYGNAAGVVGPLLVTEALVCLGTPSDGLMETLERTGMTVVGGAWATLLVLVIWRLYPYGPARRSVGDCWLALGGYAEALGHLHRGVAADGDWARVSSRRRSAARDAIEAARAILAGERRRRTAESRRGALLLLLLSEADQVFETVLALSEILENACGDVGISAQRALRVMLLRIGEAATQLGSAITQGRPAAPVRLAATLDMTKRRLAAEAGRCGLSRDAADHVVALLDRIAPYFSLATDMTAEVQQARGLADPAGAEPTPADIASGPSAWTVLRSNLGFSSLNFRHALRLALAATASVWLARHFEIERGYWIGVTATVILQPYLATTWQRGLERVAGSVLGGLIAAAIGLAFPSPMAVVVILFPLSILTMAVRGVNYTLFVLCLTPQFVLIAELFQTGDAPNWHLAGLRALNSVLGGLLGLAAGFLLWPSREQAHLPDQLAKALRAHADYLAAALGGADDVTLQSARRGCGLASNNAEASLQRLLGEPRRRPHEGVEPAMTIVTCLRRLAGAAAAISLLPPAIRQAAAGRLEALTAWAGASLQAIADDISASARPVPPLPALTMPEEQPPGQNVIDSELGRIERQVEVLHGAAVRFNQPDEQLRNPADPTDEAPSDPSESRARAPA